MRVGRCVSFGAAIGFGAAVLPAAAQTPIELSTETEPVLLRFSNPWTPLETEEIRPVGRIVNEGDEPIRVVLFLQRPFGFETTHVRVSLDTEGRLRLRAGGEAAIIGGPERPIWVTGVVEAGGEADLADWAPPRPTAVAALLGKGRIQAGILVAAARGSLAARISDLAPPGDDGRDPAEYGFLFPHGIYLTGTHALPGRWFDP